MSTRSLLRLARAVLRDRRAATALEYALIVALVVLAMLAGLRAVADSTNRLWNFVANEVIARA